MSNFNFDDVFLDPKISVYSVPMPSTDDISTSRIARIEEISDYPLSRETNVSITVTSLHHFAHRTLSFC
jgi:hypothetical protein